MGVGKRSEQGESPLVPNISVLFFPLPFNIVQTNFECMSIFNDIVFFDYAAISFLLYLFIYKSFQFKIIHYLTSVSLNR